MRWSEKAFQARVRAHCKRLGITLTALLKRADVTEDYLRHPPEIGRNIAGIFKIAEALDINPAELMGLELSSEERRSVTMVAHIMATCISTVRRPLKTRRASRRSLPP